VRVSLRSGTDGIGKALNVGWVMMVLWELYTAQKILKGHTRYTAGPLRHTAARVRGGMQERLCLVKVVVRQAADLTSRVKGVSGVCMVMWELYTSQSTELSRLCNIHLQEGTQLLALTPWNCSITVECFVDVLACCSAGLQAP
jgi:hypothetical protein